MSERPAVRRYPVRVIAALVGFGYVLLVLAACFPAFQNLSKQQKASNSDFLPKSAESTRALSALEGFGGKDVLPTVVLYESRTAITPADQARAVQDLTLIRNHHGWFKGQASAPVVSKDGKAIQVVLPLDGADLDQFILNVKDLRALLDRPGLSGGVKVYVTGLGGNQADLFEIFTSIDGSLLVATLVIVIVILLIVYRSPILWMLPLLTVGVGFVLAGGVVSQLASSGIIDVDGQSRGVLPVLVFGAGTDYALLIIARYREELHRCPRSIDAMRAALRGAIPPILASAATVILGMLCLLASELSSNSGLGPVAALGVAGAAVTTIVLLPALLLVSGRWVFWPRVPHVDGLDPVSDGPWAKVAGMVSRRTTSTAVGTGLVLVALSLLVTGLKAHGIPQSKIVLTQVESATGQQALERHFPAGLGNPVDIIAPAEQVPAVLTALQADKGVTSAAPLSQNGSPLVVNGLSYVVATLSDPGDSRAAERTVTRLRSSLDTVSTRVLVGGNTAIFVDIEKASTRDRRVIIPLVLLVILLVLALLLRSIVAPLLLVASVVLSFVATLGVCAVVFNHVFGFAGADAAFPLFAFVFIVALGIDYNIFLMTRVREESVLLGTRAGTLKGLTVTGGVITSAGIVLAATFTALGVLPLVPFAEIGFAVAFGVLLDTFVVRSLLVPAVVLLIGDKVWWPSTLAQPSSRGSSTDSTTVPATSSTL